jgi:predicted lipoprotein with Yx(FWY)xxD motif
VIAALALAGCGDDSGGESGGAYGGKGGSATNNEPAASTSGGGEAAVVSVATVAGIGPILVSSDSHTLYDFHKDQGTTSSCYGACAKLWPPLLTAGKPQPRNGASASKLGTTKRKDGTVQVTYAGYPLYTYAADKRPGEANGHDIESFGAEWYALTASGAEAED